MARIAQHIVYLTVECGGRCTGAMAHEEHMLAFLFGGRMSVHEDIGHSEGIVDAVEQRMSHAHLLEERLHALHIAP